MSPLAVEWKDIIDTEFASFTPGIIETAVEELYKNSQPLEPDADDADKKANILAKLETIKASFTGQLQSQLDWALDLQVRVSSQPTSTSSSTWFLHMYSEAHVQVHTVIAGVKDVFDYYIRSTLLLCVCDPVISSTEQT